MADEEMRPVKQKEPSRVSSMFKRDWREKYRTSTEQYYYMYRKGIATDCTLVADKDGKKEEFQVHRLQLVRASRQFHFLIAKENAMGTGEGLKIELNQFSPKTVKLMLRCIYEDKVELQSFEDAFNITLAAHMYEIKPLLDIGAKGLIKYLTPEKIYHVWSLSQTITLPDVTQSCIEALKLDTLQCITGTHFVANVSEDFVVLLLEQDELSVKDELVLVNATVSWARNEAKNRGLSGDDAGVRTVIEPRILGLLRLLTIPLEIFVTGPGLSGWLTEEEKREITNHINHKEKDELPTHLCNSRGMRKKTAATEENVSKRRSNVCKRFVITQQPNLEMGLNMECTFCTDPALNPTPVTVPGKCLHARGVFRVKSSCSLVGFECLSREFKTEDPTYIYKRWRTSYKECIDVMLISYGLSLAMDGPVNPRFKTLCSMQFKEDTHFDSTMKIKFPRPILLKTNSWYGLGIMFRSTNVEEKVEYPHHTRPARVISTSGVEFRFQTKEIPGYINSTNDGVFKTLLLS